MTTTDAYTLNFRTTNFKIFSSSAVPGAKPNTNCEASIFYVQTPKIVRAKKVAGVFQSVKVWKQYAPVATN